MSSFLKNFFGGEVEVDPDSWHGKWYNYWLKKGGENKSGYMENFCHYVRVLLFWAPLKWFLYANVLKVVRPCTVMLVAAILSFIGVASIIWPATVLKVFLVTVAIVGGGILWALLLAWLSHTSPIRRLGAWGKAHEKPLGIMLVGSELLLFLVVLGIFAYKYPIPFAIAVGSLLGVAVIGVVGYGIRQYFHERRIAEPASVPQPWRPLNGVGGTVRLAGQYVIARKRRICPFITFKQRASQPS